VIGHRGALFILHKMSDTKGWSHSEMMKMKKSVLWRYFGYWYQEQLNEEARLERLEKENKNQSNGQRNWKSL
jgi:hypothetical protein